jgi:signal-transduction protein with cAMP-binding, CBS, and nucleotidyltransferase domain
MTGSIAVRISEICTRSVVTCPRDMSTRDLARMMRKHHVGSVVVVDRDHAGAYPVGVVTDRDLVVEVMAVDVDPSLTSAEDLIVSEPETALDSELVFDAVCHMQRKGIRRLPVVDAQGRLLGILTADDVARFLSTQLVDIAGLERAQVAREEDKQRGSP